MRHWSVFCFHDMSISSWLTLCSDFDFPNSFFDCFFLNWDNCSPSMLPKKPCSCCFHRNGSKWSFYCHCSSRHQVSFCRSPAKAVYWNCIVRLWLWDNHICIQSSPHWWLGPQAQSLWSWALCMIQVPLPGDDTPCCEIKH